MEKESCCSVSVVNQRKLSKMARSVTRPATSVNHVTTTLRTEMVARSKVFVLKRALAVILYALGKASFGFLGKLFGVSRSLTYAWIRAESDKIAEPVVSGGIREMEFDELWHFVGSKKNKKCQKKCKL